MGGAVFLARKTVAQVQKPAAGASAPTYRNRPPNEVPQPNEIDRLAQKLLEAAPGVTKLKRLTTKKGGSPLTASSMRANSWNLLN